VHFAHGYTVEATKVLVNQAYRYELQPNNRQVGLLIKHCGVARFAYNWGLARRIELYKTKEGKERFTSAMTQHKELNALKKTDYPWMYEVSKCAPQEALRNLDTAYRNMFRRIKNHEGGMRKPKFKKKGIHDSFSLNGIVKALDGAIQLPRIGKVRTKETTSKLAGRILSATVSREADRWYCSLDVEANRPEVKPTTNEIVGIDLGLNDFAVISNEKGYEHIKAPKPLKKRLKKVKRLNKQQSRKQLKSNNRKKANLRIARQYRKIKNNRKDFVSKLTSELAKTKSVIVIEDLAVGNMVKNKHLARSISDVGWGEFRRQLEYKTEWYGSRLIKTPRFEPSSKMCSKCGAINSELKLSDRIWICENCGTTHDRDENAATNIRNEGIRILNTESSSGIQACGESVSPHLKKAVLCEAGSKHKL
jgi:putative transposase